MNLLSKLPLGLLLAVLLAVIPLAVLAQEETSGLLVTLDGHTGAVNSLAFSPDGTLLATGGADHMVRVWDAVTGELRLELEGHTGEVTGVAFSPDGSLLVSSGLDGTLRLWRPLTEGAVSTLADETRIAGITSIAFNPDGTMLAASDDQGAVRLWEVASWTSFNLLQTEDSALFDVTWSDDGTVIVSGSREGNVWLWDAASNAQLGSRAGEIGEIYAVAFGPVSDTGALLAFGGVGDTVGLWDLMGGQAHESLQAGTGVRSLEFFAEGRLLVYGNEDTAVFWDVEFSQQVGTLGSHTSAVRDIALNPDQTVLAVGYEDGAVKLWDMNTTPSEPAPEGTVEDLTETFTSADGSLSFNYPAAWSAVQEADSPIISLASDPAVLERFNSGSDFEPGEILVFIHMPEAVTNYLAAQVAAPASASIHRVADVYIRSLSEPFSYPVELMDISGVRAETVGGSYDGLLYILEQGDESYIAVVVAAVTDHLTPFTPTLDAVVESISYTAE